MTGKPGRQYLRPRDLRAAAEAAAAADAGGGGDGREQPPSSDTAEPAAALQETGGVSTFAFNFGQGPSEAAQSEVAPAASSPAGEVSPFSFGFGSEATADAAEGEAGTLAAAMDSKLHLAGNDDGGFKFNFGSS